MPTYKFDGLLHSPATMYIEADSRREAWGRAIHSDWDRVVQNGEGDDFTINDSDWEDEGIEPDGPGLNDDDGDLEVGDACPICGTMVDEYDFKGTRQEHGGYLLCETTGCSFNGTNDPRQPRAANADA